MEFSTHKSTFLSDFCRLLEEHHFAPKVAERGYSKIVYFKDSSRIEDLLATMGAVERTLELMNTKIVKEIRNSVNRRANCESANIDKTVEAAAADCAAILYLKECGAFETLSDNVIFCYKVDNPYSRENDRSVCWHDESIGVEWLTKEPILSDKDKNAPLLKDSDCNFIFRG